MKHIVFDLALAAMCCSMLFASCESPIEESNVESEERVPITFTAQIGEIPQTRIIDNAFEQNDEIGLFAYLTENGNLSTARYFDNEKLKAGTNNALNPEKQLFYPENKASLTFKSYYPYHTAGISAGSTTLPVTIATNQDDDEAFSKSQFLVAEAEASSATNTPVTFNYIHQFAKINLKLVSKDLTAEELKNVNPAIMAHGFCTQADFDLVATDNKLSNLTNPKDITLHGSWTVISDDAGTSGIEGLEFIIFPQETPAQPQSFSLYLSGRLYTCAFPTETKVEAAKMYDITIDVTPTEDKPLTGMVSAIKPWEKGENMNTDNSAANKAVYLNMLSFKESNVYKVTHKGKDMAIVCKEYLAGDINAQAITSYPVNADGTTDLTKGKILKVLASEVACNGATLAWNTADNSFTVTGGSADVPSAFYLSSANEIVTEPDAENLELTVKADMLYDSRATELIKYPIVKVGTQFWMRDELEATFYNDGTAIEKLGKPDGTPAYFQTADSKEKYYSGEAALKDIAPKGWRVPTDNDWKVLATYVNNDAAKVKAGTWLPKYEEKPIAPVNNLVMFDIIPNGILETNGSVGDSGARAVFWESVQEEIPLKLKGFYTEDGDFHQASGYSVDNKAYYVAQIRCIKE